MEEVADDADDETTEAAGKEAASAKPSAWMELERLRDEVHSERAAKNAAIGLMNDALQQKTDLLVQLGEAQKNAKFEFDDKMAWKRDCDETHCNFDKLQKDFDEVKEERDKLKEERRKLRNEVDDLEDDLKKEREEHMKTKLQYEAIKAKCEAQETAQSHLAAVQETHAKAMQDMKEELAQERLKGHQEKLSQMVRSHTCFCTTLY